MEHLSRNNCNHHHKDVPTEKSRRGESRAAGVQLPRRTLPLGRQLHRTGRVWRKISGRSRRRRKMKRGQETLGIESHASHCPTLHSAGSRSWHRMPGHSSTASGSHLGRHLSGSRSAAPNIGPFTRQRRQRSSGFQGFKKKRERERQQGPSTRNLQLDRLMEGCARRSQDQIERSHEEEDGREHGSEEKPMNRTRMPGRHQRPRRSLD